MSDIQIILNKVQKDLVVPKGQYNEFGKYKYRSCEDILEAVKPLLPDDVIITINDELLLIGERYYVKATACIQKGDEGIFGVAYARESESRKGMDESQITGSASSYARKYALNGLLLIDDTKDADSTNKHETEKPKGIKADKVEKAKPAPQAKKDPPREATSKPMNRTQNAKLIWLCQQKGMDVQDSDNFKTWALGTDEATEAWADKVIVNFDGYYGQFLDSAIAENIDELAAKTPFESIE